MNSTEPSTLRAPNKGHRQTLLGLIERRKEAMKLDLDAWTKFGEVEDSEAMQSMPFVRVQLGKLRHGYDDEGNPIEEPIWGRTAEQVRNKMQKDFDAWMTFMVPKSGPIRDKAVAEWEKNTQAKLDELAALQAEADRIKQESGYNEALSIAWATTDAVKRIDRAIVGFIPRTLDQAATLASWVIEARKEKYSHLEDEDFALVLGSIASAKAPATREVAA